jgi:hypothetical protein
MKNQKAKELTIELVSNAVVAVPFYPIELVGITLMTQDVLIARDKRYHGFFDALLSIAKRDGVFALWKGLYSRLLTLGVNQLASSCSSEITSSLRPMSQSQPMLLTSRTVIDVITNYCSLLFAYPLDTTFTRLAVQDARSNIGIAQCMKTVYSDDGLRGLYRGSSIAFLSIVTYRLTFVATYKALRSTIQVRSEEDIWKLWVQTLISSTTALAVTYPMEVIRRQMIVTNEASAIRSYNHIMETEGIAGLFRGFLVQFVTTSTGSFLGAILAASTNKR